MGIGCVEMIFGCNRIRPPRCLLQRYVFLQLSNHTEISLEEPPFPYFIGSWRKTLVAWCTPPACLAGRVGCTPPVPCRTQGCHCLCCAQYPGCSARPLSPMATAVKWGARAWWEHLGDFFRANKVLWLHPLLTRIIIRNKWCALRLEHLKWAACITPCHVCLLLLSVVCFLPILLLLLCKTITCRTENFSFVESN